MHNTPGRQNGFEAGYQQNILPGFEHETQNSLKMLPGFEHESRNPKYLNRF